MKFILLPSHLIVTLAILITSFWYSGSVSAQSSVPLVTVRFANPEWNSSSGRYCADVEFRSDTTHIQVFGMNVRFFYDDAVLEFAGFEQFASGYAAVQPSPPYIHTSPAGPSLFNFQGPADFVNGAIQLVNSDTPVILDTVQWTKLYSICFELDDADPNMESFCPSLVWDMEANPANGGFLAGDDGVVITVVNPDPSYDSAPSIENVVQFNWRYIGSGGIPWGEPIEEACIALGMPLTLSVPQDWMLECTESTDPAATGFATATDACEGDVVITFADEIVYGECSYDLMLTRIWTATNNCGESILGSQAIQVIDTSIPVMTAPEDITISCISNTSPNVTGMATAIDNCGEEPMVFIEGDSVTEQTCTNRLVIIRSFTAFDACGNMANCTQRITVQDTLPPTFSVPSYALLNHLSPDSSTQFNLSDTSILLMLGDLNESSIVVIDQCDDQLIPDFSVSITSAQNCAEQGYAEQRVYSWLMTDACGNSTDVHYTVDIMDDIAPVLTGVPADELIFCEQLPPAPIVYADDTAQPVTITFTELIVEGIEPGTYDVVRKWTATDACGNSSMDQQHITWRPASLLTCTISVPKWIACNSDKVVIKSKVIGDFSGVTYHWELIGEGAYILSGQGTSRIIIHIGSTPVIASLTLTDQYGCEAVCTSWVKCGYSAPHFVKTRSTIDTSGAASNMISPDQQTIAEQQNLSIESMMAWPNPTTGQVNIRFDSRQAGMLQVAIFNILGQVMKREELECEAGLNVWSLDLSDMKDGSYYLKIDTERESITKVIVLLRL